MGAPDAPAPGVLGPTADLGLPDTPAHDATFLDLGGRPVGQCFDDDHCYFGFPCLADLPGGACGCQQPWDCGDEFTYDCIDGRCKRMCTMASHCPLGHGCSAEKLCDPLSCGGLTPCPGPYDCQEGTCARPPCAAQAPLCPSGMICSAAGLCLENYY